MTDEYQELLAEYGGWPEPRAVASRPPVDAPARIERGPDPVLVLAEAVRGQLRKRDAEIAGLKRDIAALRDRLDTATKLQELGRRLDKLEGGAEPQAPARAAPIRAIG
jgi:hypothetical protein